MKKNLVLFTLLCLVVMGAVAAGAADMVLEAQPRVSAAAEDPCDIFYVCSYWHELSPNYCTIWHVVYCGPIETKAPEGGFSNEIEKAFVGRELGLESRSSSLNAKINRVVPQYHLASGAVVEPTGRWNARNAKGETWQEVRSYNKRSFSVSRWEDSNKDGMVGVGDRVVFADGTKSTIKAVRLGVHVTPIS